MLLLVSMYFYALIAIGVGLHFIVNRPSEDSWLTTWLVILAFAPFWPVLIGSKLAQSEYDFS